jgi:LysR family transcriptional regulator of gallate degradation
MDIFRLRRLWAALAVYETGSALKAAAFSHMSQSAITSAIATCEADLGVALFERSSRGMTPTQAGAVWCPRIAAAADYLKEAEAALHHWKRRSPMPIQKLVTETQLRALSAVIETGGFSQAARQLGVSQPSVHRAARELETLCGVPLWRREGSRVEPTNEARTLARFGDLCFSEISLAQEAVREIQGIMEGTLRIGALPLARSQWLPKALAATLTDFPDARVTIVDGPYNEQATALLHGRIDFLLGALRKRSPENLTQEKVFTDPVLILVRADHPLAPDFDSRTDKLTPEQLGELSWILPRSGTPGRSNFEDFMRSKGLPLPHRVIESSSLVATREILLRSNYAAILSAQQVEAEVSTGLLKVMGPPLTGSDRDIGITTRSGFLPTRLHAAFLSNLRDAIRTS